MERRVGQMNWPDAREVLRIWQRELVLRPSRPFRRGEESVWTRLACRALRHDRVLWRLSVVLTATWMRLARGVLRFERVLWRLSVVLTATWMRLARGALRFERTRLAWMRLARGALRFFERARLAAANAQAAYEKS